MTVLIPTEILLLVCLIATIGLFAAGLVNLACSRLARGAMWLGFCGIGGWLTSVFAMALSAGAP